MTFDDLQATYDSWMDFGSDRSILRIVYGSYVANLFDGNPLWLMIIGTSGAGKTELIMPLGEYDRTVAVSSMTPKGLLSGAGDKEANSLLLELKNKVLVVKDLSTVTEMSKEERGELFSILRDAYDGQVRRHTGLGSIEFKGKFGMIAAGTPAMEMKRAMENSLGERFITVRPRLSSPGNILDAAIRNAARKNEMRGALGTASREFLRSVAMPTRESRLVNREVERTARECAVVLSRMRSSVARDFQSEIEFPVAVTEIPTRLYEQFLLLALGMQHIGATDTEIVFAIKRVMLDSAPYVRMKVLECIADGFNRSIVDVSRRIHLSEKHTRQTIEELFHLGVVESDHAGQHFQVVLPFLDNTLKNGVRFRPC